ncbi:hypothetical protein BCR35DRAFT_353776 [Leucosporidium creatinivorum]|uniref:NAD(P)-binding protein n=1 Tax=Leucosporidium creatinivorum TaxID=106004 RepID=A0A1Y2ET60_9BASI|nr:hypothetical protein BCR35DRAFT_353776 [Leucosporidium creatinivorum]
MATTILYEQFFGKMDKPIDTPLNGRIVIVTGSNTGLGLQTAIHLARLAPARLILAVRSVEKGAAARDTLLAAKGVASSISASAVEVWPLDLASFASVNAFAARAEAELPRLDIVVENAGVNSWKQFGRTADGWETTLQVNDLATGLLAVLLFPLLRKTAALPPIDPSAPTFKPHLTLTGSEVHLVAKFHEGTLPGSILDNLNDETIFQQCWSDRYNTSKLLNIFLSRKLAELAGDKVVVNVVNPGLCETELGRDLPRIMVMIMRWLARTAEQGARNIAWAATEDTSAEPGAYVSVQAVKPTSPFTHSNEGKEAEAKVWEEMVALWKKVGGEEAKRALRE